MQEDSSVENLLTRLQADGRRDSQGHFTLDLNAQARKLAQLQSHHPALYLLKGVQVASVMRAAHLHVKLARAQVSLRFSPRNVGEHAFPLKSLFQDSELSKAAGHLKSLLLAAVATSAEEIHVVWIENGWVQNLGWKQGDITFEERRRVSAETPLFEISIALARPGWLSRLLPSRLCATLASELVSRCQFCDFPVILDGRKINSPFPEQLLTNQGETSQDVPDEEADPQKWRAEHWWLCSRESELKSFCLASPICRGPKTVRVGSLLVESCRSGGEAVVPEQSGLIWLDGDVADRDKFGQTQLIDPGPGQQPGGDALIPPDSMPVGYHLKKSSNADRTRWPSSRIYFSALRYLRKMGGATQPEISTQGAPLNWSLPALRLSRWLALPKKPGAPSQLFYIQDGVLLNSIAIVTGIAGTLAMIAKSDLKTDLSLLEVVQDEDFLQDVQWVLKEEETLKEAARNAGAAAWKMQFNGSVTGSAEESRPAQA